MKELLAIDYYDCPMCGQACRTEEETRGYNTPLYVQGACQVFLCHTPLATDPLHYYSHIVEKSKPDVIAYQEFSVDIGRRYILFANNYKQEKTLIRNQRNENALELPFIIFPDFPDLTSLKSKVRLSMVFS
jgi:hypothetical protein